MRSSFLRLVCTLILACAPLAACTGDRTVKDGDGELRKELTALHMTLPDCAGDARYLPPDVFGKSLYLTFTGDEACVATFLDGNRLAVHGQLAGRYLAFNNAQYREKLGWSFDNDRKYAEFTVQEDGVQSDAVVDRAADPQRVWLAATRIG